jgi:ABC-type phosphate/phosphonate transport system substrate-binding protein
MRTALAIMILALLTGCSSAPKPGEQVLLKVAVNDIYCTDTACSCVHDVAARTYQTLVDELAAQSGIDLQFDYFIEPYELEDAIRSGMYDGALCKPWLAMRIEQETGSDFRRIVDVLDPDNNRWLTGIVIVTADSPITSLKELDGKHIYLGEPDAYEKHQAALRLFTKEGIVPGKIDTHASCIENIGALLDGKADAAMVSDYALSADCAVDFANPDDFRILARTEKIPLTSLMLDMKKVDAGNAGRLKKALLDLSGEAAPESLLSDGFVDPSLWNPPELEEPL